MFMRDLQLHPTYLCYRSLCKREHIDIEIVKDKVGGFSYIYYLSNYKVV